jgi:hypothetical protein
MASCEGVRGIRHWIIPECDCDYHVEAYVTHLLAMGQGKTAWQEMGGGKRTHENHALEPI